MRRHALPHDIIISMNEARAYADQQIIRNHPNHFNLVHTNFQGMHYHFYRHNQSPLGRPSSEDVQLAVRDIRQELYSWEEGNPDQSVDFRTPSGHLAAAVHRYDRELVLDNFQTVVRVYITWLYFTERHPRDANVEIILE